MFTTEFRRRRRTIPTAHCALPFCTRFVDFLEFGSSWIGIFVSLSLSFVFLEVLGLMMLEILIFFFRCDGRKKKICIYKERERKESEEMAPTRRRWRDRLPPVFSTTYIIGIRQPLVLVQCSPPPSPLIGITYTNLPVPSFRKFPTTLVTINYIWSNVRGK